MILYKITVFCIVLIASGANVCAQHILWANKVLGYSSEYRPGQYGYANRAKQILGQPNKLPDVGGSACAWSPADADSKSEEWIKVAFEKSIPLRQVAVAENLNPGAIARIYAYSETGTEFLIWKNNPGNVPERGRMLRIFPTQENLTANAIKIVMQPDRVPGFNQVDAIGISSQETPIEAVINVAANIPKDLIKENLGKAINSKGQELAPIISPDSKTLYFTRSNHPENIGSAFRQDVWYATLNNKNQWNQAVNIGAPINNAGDNAITSISSDGKTIYLINKYRPDGSMTFGLSKSFLTKTGWSFPKEVKMTDLYNDQQEGMDLTVSPHGNVMILSIQRRDTEGDKDLYVSFLQKDESWSEPLHMGSVINTAEYEGTPFLALDNKTLYFSSQGQSGYGKSDLFLSKRLDDSWVNWSRPENLGPVINTPLWDVYFNIPAAGDYAYFSSSDNSMGLQDIFRLTLPQEMKPEPVAIISGTVFNAETNRPITSAISADLKKNNAVFTQAEFNPESDEYRLILPVKEIYRITASEKGYFPVTEELDLSGESKFRNIRKNLYLQPIRAGQQIRLNNTMFAQSSAEVVASSFSELDRIVSLMNEYPAMEILLEGHTDNQGEVQKNIKLSEDRVLQVKKYLLSKGITDKRIQTKAWGPAKPIASNATEQTRQKNRRVEFTILKIQ
jgi:outer membrane protein OmpA-like peptidoglycan-associated protein